MLPGVKILQGNVAGKTEQVLEKLSGNWGEKVTQGMGDLIYLPIIKCLLCAKSSKPSGDLSSIGLNVLMES
jgi:hypothetical protein